MNESVLYTTGNTTKKAGSTQQPGPAAKSPKSSNEALDRASSVYRKTLATELKKLQRA